MSTESVSDGKVVLIHYTLKNDAGEVLDRSDGNDPLPYLHGADNIVIGLERALAGKGVGDKVSAKIPPEQGYGPREGQPEKAPRDAFPADMELVPGMPVTAQSPDGQVIPFWIIAVEADHVILDANHPLAGETLNFDVEIAGIRAATAEELELGHPQGPDDQPGA